MSKLLKEEGRYFIEVFGQQPVEQATLDLIFEVDYLGGRLLAEYAVTLPPFGSPITINESPIQPTPEQEATPTETLEAEVVLEEAVAQLVASQAETTKLDTVVVASSLLVWLNQGKLYGVLQLIIVPKASVLGKP